MMPEKAKKKKDYNFKTEKDYLPFKTVKFTKEDNRADW